MAAKIATLLTAGDLPQYIPPGEYTPFLARAIHTLMLVRATAQQVRVNDAAQPYER